MHHSGDAVRQRRLLSSGAGQSELHGYAGHANHHIRPVEQSGLWFDAARAQRDCEFGIGSRVQFANATRLQGQWDHHDALGARHMHHSGDAVRQRRLLSSGAGQSELHGYAGHANHHIRPVEQSGLWFDAARAQRDCEFGVGSQFQFANVARLQGQRDHRDVVGYRNVHRSGDAVRQRRLLCGGAGQSELHGYAGHANHHIRPVEQSGLWLDAARAQRDRQFRFGSRFQFANAARV